MELIIILLFIIALLVMMKMYDVLKDISESLRLLANNPKTIEEARKIRLQSKNIEQ